jgi:hypothetical protein
MTAQESIRLDLYNGLQELLGNDRATYLMTHLLPAEAPDLLTKTEFRSELRSELRAALGELRAEVAGELAALEKRIDDRLEHKFDQVNKRLDRVLLTVVGSMSVILAAVISSGLWS